jgi:hypothetical protein
MIDTYGIDTTAAEMLIATSATAHASASFHRGHPAPRGAAPWVGGAAGTLVGAVSSSAVVVIIVGAVIWSLAYLMVRGVRPTATGPKPATAWQPAAFATEDPAPPAWVPTELEADRPVEPLPPLPPPRRTRALVLLSLSVAVLGAVAAGLIGAVTFLVAHVVDKALG